jgi:hypothetical protein
MSQMVKKSWIRWLFWTGIMFPIMGILALLMHGPFNISISTENAQNRINQKLPLVYSSFTGRYQVNDLRIDFQENGRVGLQGDFVANTTAGQVQGQMHGSGRLSYDHGSFHLRDVQVDTLNIGTFDESKAATRLSEPVRQMILRYGPDLLTRALRSGLNRHPVYVLQSTDTRHGLAKLALKGISVHDGRVEVTLDPATLLLRVLSYLAIALVSISLGIAMVMASFNGHAGLAWLFVISS